MQASFPAPSLPLWQIGAAVFSANPIRAAIALRGLKSYRDVATNSWPAVRDMIVNAYNRCPQRTILLAGYSFGGIILRYVVPHLPASVRRQVARVDLVADPTEQGSIDSALRHSGGFWARSTPEGLDTFSGRRFNPFFKQTHYPSDVTSHAFQYCVPYDIVCEANPVNFAALAGEGKRHRSYNWSGIGNAAAHTADARRYW